MPNLTFVLPHWMYWSGLVLIPLLAILILRHAPDEEKREVTLPVAYFLLVTAGFVGLHRFYLRNLWGALFIPLFVGILYANIQARDARDGVSHANNEVLSTEFLLERAQKKVADGSWGQEKVTEAEADLERARAMIAAANAGVQKWTDTSRWLAIVILIGLLVDAVLMPKLLRRCRELDQREALHDKPVQLVEAEPEDYLESVPDSAFVHWVGRLNDVAGQFVAYWSIVAVIVYYYEVIARYVFNSPTNWAHESMFLMFGMQYLLAGGYVLRHNGHVRVDVFYTHFSPRNKAIVDILTSVFFFIFAGTLLWTGWTFFADSFAVREVSFTEWAIQYYPVKLAIPLGAALILLQGLAWLSKDVALLLNSKEA